MKRIPSLDGLRAISVFLVLFGHYVSHRPGAVHYLSPYANSGVRMFFVISGYLITTILLKEHARTAKINLWQFYIRRAYRILPAAGAFMLFALIVYWRELRWFDVGAMLLYLVDFDRSRPWMIGHLWSLGVEEQFYLLWPGALAKAFRYRVPILLGVVAISPVYSALCYHFRVPGGGYGTFPAVADNLAIGCLLAIFGAKIPAIPGWIAALMLGAVIAIPFYPGDTAAKTLIELFILWPLMNCCMAGLLLHVVRRRYWLLNVAPVLWIGRLSYSLYLWQQPFFFSAPGGSPHRPYLALSLACLSYYLIEKPVLDLREKRSIHAGNREASPFGSSPVRTRQ